MVKYWRGDLTNQLREYKYRHIKPIFRSDYSDHSFQNNRFLFLNFPIDGKVENGRSNDWKWTTKRKLTVKRKWTVKRLNRSIEKWTINAFFKVDFLKMDGQTIEIKSGRFFENVRSMSFSTLIFEIGQSSDWNQKWLLLIVPKCLI